MTLETFVHSFSCQSRMARSLADADPSNAYVSQAYKGITSALGLVTDGLGMVAGFAMTGTGAALIATPEPTTLTKWAGVPLTAYGAAYTTKSAIWLRIESHEFGFCDPRHINGVFLHARQRLEWAVKSSGGSPDAERAAVAADLAWGLASGRVLDARLATGAVTSPRVAALLQPAVTTTIGREATVVAPGTWAAYTRIDPKAGFFDLGVKSYENIYNPLAEPSNK
jgi:hypothetical protein